MGGGGAGGEGFAESDYDELLRRGLFEDTRGGGGDGGDWDIVDLYGATDSRLVLAPPLSGVCGGGSPLRNGRGKRQPLDFSTSANECLATFVYSCT